MQNDRQYIKHSLNIIFLLLSLIISSALFYGCTQKTYTYTLDEYSFSFKYSGNDQVFPHSRFLPSTISPSPPKITKGAIISIGTFQTTKPSSHVDFFTDYMEDQKGISYFSVDERGTLIIGENISAEYINYGYDTYDISPVSYQGIFISFVHNGYLIDVDFLSWTGSPFADEAYDLFLKTFTIRN